jgi:hypothetical protein
MMKASARSLRNSTQHVLVTACLSNGFPHRRKLAPDLMGTCGTPWKGRERRPASRRLSKNFLGNFGYIWVEIQTNPAYISKIFSADLE